MQREKFSERSVHFGLFEFDRDTRCLYRCGVSIHLQRQAAVLLDLLLGRANQIVTRKEVHNQLWPGQEAGDFDSRINFEVKQIRDALRDDPHNPVYIETISKLGYRFIGPVQMINAGRSSPEKPTTPVDHFKAGEVYGIPHDRWQVRLRSKKSFAVLVIVIIAVVVALSGMVTWRHLVNRPMITFVTPILPQPNQTILIRGHGFGKHTSFTNVDTPFMSIRDQTGHWAAGRIIDRNFDEVTLTVVSWAESEIVVTEFAGAYGRGDWKLKPNDEIQVAVWNPQTGIGPAIYTLHVGNPKTPH
jgi:DNA-binding winged helix-turn-helix (wHTH) protein